MNVQQTDKLQKFSDLICAGDLPSAQALYSAEPWLKECKSSDDWGRTWLHLAAEKGKSDVVRWLLDIGFDPNAGDCRGDCALTLAVMSLRYLVVKVLLDAGANPNKNSSSDRSLLHHIAGDFSVDVPAIIGEFAKRGADVNSIDRHGRTPLSIAARRNLLENIKSLLACGADPFVEATMDQVRAKDWNALEAARSQGCMASAHYIEAWDRARRAQVAIDDAMQAQPSIKPL